MYAYDGKRIRKDYRTPLFQAPNDCYFEKLRALLILVNFQLIIETPFFQFRFSAMVIPTTVILFLLSFINYCVVFFFWSVPVVAMPWQIAFLLLSTNY